MDLDSNSFTDHLQEYLPYRVILVTKRNNIYKRLVQYLANGLSKC